MDICKIHYLQPKYSWSYDAAKRARAKHGNELTNLIGDKTIDDVVKNTSDSHSIGIVPIYNTLNGDMEEHIRFLYDNLGCNNYIGDTVKLQIVQCLCGIGSVEDVKEIVSHPKALDQAKNKIVEIMNHGGRKITTNVCDSTSAAAKMVGESGKAEMAAICSKSVAEAYGLNVLMPMTHGNNETTFGIIGDETYWADYYAKQPYGSASRITAIIIQPPEDYKGLLKSIINPLSAEYDLGESISLTKGPLLFYIEIKGTQDQKLFEVLQSICDDISANGAVLGNYPAVQRAEMARDVLNKKPVKRPKVIW